MRFLQTIFNLMVILSLAIPAWAEFYRYVDPHGNVVYTDDLSKVPPDQRDKVQPYVESQSPPPPVVEKKADAPAKTPAADGALEKERQQLKSQEKDLNQEYENLMKMRSQLNKDKAKAVTKAQIKDYNEKIIDFNKQIQSYEHKRDALAEQVKTFNKKVEENSNEKPTQ
jgi:predicted RNase H-like nuclease (RuvC/YqgF family)